MNAVVQSQTNGQNDGGHGHAAQTEQMQSSTTSTFDQHQTDQSHQHIDDTHACRRVEVVMKSDWLCFGWLKKVVTQSTHPWSSKELPVRLDRPT